MLVTKLLAAGSKESLENSLSVKLKDIRYMGVLEHDLGSIQAAFASSDVYKAASTMNIDSVWCILDTLRCYSEPFNEKALLRAFRDLVRTCRSYISKIVSDCVPEQRFRLESYFSPSLQLQSQFFIREAALSSEVVC